MRIESVTANQDSFRPVYLKPGFNVILADRTKESTRTDSRNGLGKSTLLEIIHFVLGSNLAKDQNLYALRSTSWDFTLNLTIRDITFSATRSMSNTAEVYIGGDTSALGLEVAHDRGGSVRLVAWRNFLAAQCFNIDAQQVGSETYKPSFRALIPYFARSGRGAYLNPFEARAKQLRWQTQVYNAYLLGLNWRMAAEWQHLRDSEKTLSAVGKHIDATLDQVVGQVGELESERVRLQTRLDDLVAQATNFRVVKEYKEVEDRVNKITFEMQGLSSSNTFESRLIQRYEEQIEDEAPVAGMSVVDLFQQVGVALPETAVRSLEDVNEFHRQVTMNRQEYLRSEVDRLRLQIERRVQEINALEEERQASLSLLESGGALEDFTKIQMKIVEAKSGVEALDRRIEEARRLRLGRAQLVRDKQTLEQRAVVDHEERRAVWSHAISFFARNTQYLYGQPSDLIIDVTEHGYDFRVRMESKGSHGRDNMAILCYDLTVSQIWSEHRHRPAFLIHDSEMFDPVDERQVALSLKLAAEQAAAHDYQYLALLNSDTLPVDDLKDIKLDISEYVRLTLTDTDPSGSLLGVKF